MLNRTSKHNDVFLITDVVLDAAQRALDTKIAEKGNEWIVTQIDDLKEIWRDYDREGHEKFKLVKSAIDLKCLAETLNRKNLVIVASSLYAFVETASPLSETAYKLVDLHIDAIQTLSRLRLSGQLDEQLPWQVIEELRVAAIKVAGT